MYEARCWFNYIFEITIIKLQSHVKKKRLTCRIARRFIENCSDNGFKNLRFTIVDCFNNVDGLTDDEIDDLLLKTEKFWIRTLVMQRHGLNSKHDLNRTKRCERGKLNN